MESSSPNYITHPEAFQDSQDPYDMWQIRQKEDKWPKDKMTDMWQIRQKEDKRPKDKMTKCR